MKPVKGDVKVSSVLKRLVINLIIKYAFIV